MFGRGDEQWMVSTSRGQQSWLLVKIDKNVLTFAHVIL
jgi:hypothetical protein